MNEDISTNFFEFIVKRNIIKFVKKINLFRIKLKLFVMIFFV